MFSSIAVKQGTLTCIALVLWCVASNFFDHLPSSPTFHPGLHWSVLCLILEGSSVSAHPFHYLDTPFQDAPSLKLCLPLSPWCYLNSGNLLNLVGFYLIPMLKLFPGGRLSQLKNTSLCILSERINVACYLMYGVEMIISRMF